ncbi:NUDIX hydrolase [Exiguobacterium sp. KRL4]|uniref:NUDIX hydrolase n=1 Tax=Exiguobacterium sp. KRL4 TaxID=1914536 RepID=UPI0008F96A6B|nr:NUDIX hydrolase [Exiguobacterium sp. KRL4]OIN66921.1 NUDIX hydrolase [Exiguobacterium sp. KRL4]
MDINFTVEQQRFNHRAAAVIVKEDHLLIHRNVRDDFWALPGGRIQMMEHGEQAIIREIKEELGKEVHVKQFLSAQENFFEYEGIQFHEVAFFYEVELMTLETLTLEPFHGIEGEQLIYQYVPIDRLQSVKLYPVQLTEMIQSGEWSGLFSNEG